MGGTPGIWIYACTGELSDPIAIGEPKRDRNTIGDSAAVSGTELEGADTAEPATEFCAGVEEAGLVPADCSDEGRELVNAVKGDSMLDACGDAVEGVVGGMTGLVLVAADCKGVPGASRASGTPKVLVDLIVSAGAAAGSAGAAAGSAGLELAAVLCTGTPEDCEPATAVGVPTPAEVAGKGVSGEDPSGVDGDVTGIIVPVMMDATVTGMVGLLLQEGVL